jgi:hypothetical protein
LPLATETLRGVYTECNECAQGDKRSREVRQEAG